MIRDFDPRQTPYVRRWLVFVSATEVEIAKIRQGRTGHEGQADRQAKELVPRKLSRAGGGVLSGDLTRTLTEEPQSIGGKYH